MPKLTYIKTFLKDKNVGAVAKSSKFAVEKISAVVDLSRDRIIVEYGPGDGVLTKVLLRKMTRGSRLVAIETNPSFVTHLSKKFNDPRLMVIHDKAEHCQRILKKMGVHEADYVFSGIPFSFLPKHARHDIVENTRNILASGGKFIVYQYSSSMVKPLEKIFGNVRVSFIPLNLPSYFLMEAIKER